MYLIDKLKSPNPHWYNIHVPAHVLGLGGLLWALTNPSWLTLTAFLVFNFWLSCLGMSVGFHRYFTHKAFSTTKFWARMMLIGGHLAGQGSAVFWVALHRMHHPASDQPNDIHSPRHKGLWSAYMGWIFHLSPSTVTLSRASDIIRDPLVRLLHRNYNTFLWSYWSAMLVLSLWMPDWVAGAFIAGMWAIHQEALVNSVCHDSRFGVAPWETKDGSRNVPGLELLTWGQSLHNTHHAFPKEANFGSTGVWDYDSTDIGYDVIRLIETRNPV